VRGQAPDLRIQVLDLLLIGGQLVRHTVPPLEHLWQFVQRRRLPRADLRRVNAVLRGELRKRLLLAQRCPDYLRLELC